MASNDVRDGTPARTPLVKSYFKGESITPIFDLTLREVLVEAAVNKPDHVIYSIPQYNETITFQTLLHKSEEFSRSLLYHGISKGDVVMVVGVPTCSFYVMFHGVIGIGAQFISPFLFKPKERVVVEVLEATKPKLLFLGFEEDLLLPTIEEYMSRSQKKLKVVRYRREDDQRRDKFSSYKEFLTSGSSLSEKQLQNAQSQTTCMDTTFLQTTSGTTGKFKLGLMNHRLLVNIGLFGHARRDPKHEMKIFGICNIQLDDLTPILDSITVMCNWKHELRGVVFPSTILDEPSTLLQFIQDERIETLLAFPYMLARIINKPIVDQYDLSSWKSGLLVGQAVERKAREWIYERMPRYMVGYGSTEFLAASSTSPEHTDREKFLTTVGYPHPHNEMKLIDAQDEIVDIQTVGEICVRGWSMFNGYLENGELVDCTDKEGWIRMGDLGKMDSTGHVIYFGRKSDCIIYKKESKCFYPWEIEKVAKECPAVKNAVVVGINTDAEGDTLCLCVTQKENSKLDVEEVKIFCKSKLYSRDVPELYFIFESFPTIGGRQKISRTDIKEEVLRRLQGEDLS